MGHLQLAQGFVTSVGFTGVSPICAVGKILFLIRQSCFLPPRPAKTCHFELRHPYFPSEEKNQEGTNLRPHQWEPGLIEIVMRIQSQTNRQMGKMQSHWCDREIYASKGADPVLINVTRSLYPNCNGLGIRLEDSISVLLQYAGCERVVCGIAMWNSFSSGFARCCMRHLCKASGKYLLLSLGLVLRGARLWRSQVWGSGLAVWLLQRLLNRQQHLHHEDIKNAGLNKDSSAVREWCWLSPPQSRWEASLVYVQSEEADGWVRKICRQTWLCSWILPWKNLGENWDEVWRAEPGLKVGTPLGMVLNRKGHQGSNRRGVSPALHVNEDRVNKG